jgi:MoaA/NifB/PqqE/SkfB family radical SAM enzyme
MVPLEDWSLDAKPLMFLDLKLGNICNLKCRICGSWSSSTYAVEELANDHSGNPKKSFHYQMLKQGRWPRENPQFWMELDNISDQIRYLEFTGGEPFMIQEHFDLLQRLVDRGIAKNIEIHYNTNGSLYPANAETIWQHFKLVEIAFSIDDTGARFEYQRSGAKWAEVCSNINLFKNLRRRCNNIELQVCCTVNALNALYLEETYEWIRQQDFDYIYWNMLHDAPHWSIVNLPLNAKKTITQQLLASNVPDTVMQEFQNIVNFMNTGPRKDGSAIRFELSKLDQRRGERLAVVMPELARMLGYHTNE